MLGLPPYYNRTTRKILDGFGSIFQGIEMIKYDFGAVGSANTPNPVPTELQRITVPLSFEGKENYITRLYADPDLTRPNQLTLPAMTYDFKGYRYRADRRQSPYTPGQMAQSGDNAIRYYSAAPYDVLIELYLYIRNMEEGLQIVEQIFPVFAPEYSLTLKYAAPGSNNYISQDVPIVFENIDYSNEYEGPAGTVRTITWTLQFSAKAFFYGPLNTNTGVIKETIVYLNDQNTLNLYANIDTSVDPITANITDSWNVNTSIIETPNTYIG